MKSVLLGSTALLMLIGAGAAQAADFTVPDQVVPLHSPFVGEIGAYVGLTRLVPDEEDGSTEFLFGGNARLGYWANQWLYLQGDIQGEATTAFDDSSFDNEGRQNFDAAFHAAYRSQTHALGVFAGWAATGIVDEGRMTRPYLGVEGQVYWGNFTLYGQAGYSFLGYSEDEDHGEPVDGPFVRGVVRYFHTPNDKIEAEVSHFWAHDVKTGNQGPVRELDWGILYEHQFMGSPLAMNVRYAGFRYQDFSHDTDGEPFIEHMFTIGAKVRFHQGTLREADIMGTSLDTPMFRGMSWLEESH
jgi:hypothetical protein